MTKIEEIESAIKLLSDQDMRSLREWFYEFDSETWDKKIIADQKNENSGIAKLARKALTDHRRGKSAPL